MQNKPYNEIKIDKIIDDNNDMIDLMKDICCSIENALDCVEDIELENEKSIKQDNKPNLKKMLKKDLIKLANEKGCKVKTRMTKAQLIKAIQETI